MLNTLAQPHRFYGIARRLWPWTAALSATLFVIGLYLALLSSPPDYQQGETVRIMYIHVPSAWLSLTIYVAMACGAFSSLVFKHRLADVFCLSIAPIGMVFTAICLITGALWGKPMWGAWWVWDARLTAMLILLFQYLGYLFLASSFDNRAVGMRMAAILVLVGVINIPIIKFSVEWWHTLHQPASFSLRDGIGIHPSMLKPLLTMAGACLSLTVTLTCLRVLTLRNRHKKRGMI